MGQRFQILSIIAALAAVSGVLLRCVGVFTEPWLDEIWAWNAVREAPSLVGVFRDAHFDGHASLYSFFMFMADRAGLGIIAMRIPALLCSLAAMWLSWRIASKNGEASGAVALILVSISYPLTLYGSEARGYSAMLMCGLLAWFLLEECRSCRAAVPAFWLVSCLAFLFHPTFGQFYVALAGWSFFKSCDSFVLRMKRALVWHGLPSLLIAGSWLLYLKNLPSGGGPVRSYLDVICEALSVSFGGPLMSAYSPPMTLAAVVLSISIISMMLVEIHVLGRTRDDRAVLYLLAVFVCPAIVISFMQPRSVMPRYFLTGSVCACFLAAHMIARMLSRGGAAKAFASLALAASVAGSLFYQVSFAEYGRGQYSAAVRYIMENAESELVSVSGDHDFRNEAMISYLSPLVEASGKKVVYQRAGESDGKPSDWRLVHSQDPYFAPGREISTKDGAVYILQAQFFSAPLSGWSWWIFRLASPQKSP